MAGAIPRWSAADPRAAYHPPMASAPPSPTTAGPSADGGPPRVGIDTGGTFTDVVLEGAGEGLASSRYVRPPTTPDAPCSMVSMRSG